MKKIALIALAALVGLALIIGLSWMSAYNTEISLRNQHNAQKEVCVLAYSNFTNIVTEKVKGIKFASDETRKFFVDLMNERNPDNRTNMLASFVGEAQPDFPVGDLIGDLNRSIEALRTTVNHAQERQVDIKREHDNLRMHFPSSLFVGGKPALENELIISAAAQEAFETGVDKPLNMFGEP